MLGWDYVASLRFPFLRGPSSTKAKARPALAQDSFFARHRPLQEQALDGPLPHEKSAQLALSAFALVVIRLEIANVNMTGCI